jgi:hypothetical protein
MTGEYLYDVAFSFLSQDESLAVQLNDSLKDRLTTFIYSDSKRQAELAGRDSADRDTKAMAMDRRADSPLFVWRHHDCIQNTKRIQPRLTTSE